MYLASFFLFPVGGVKKKHYTIPSLRCQSEIMPLFRSKNILIKSLKSPCTIKAAVINLTDTEILMNNTNLHIVAKNVNLIHSKFNGTNFTLSIVADKILIDTCRFEGNHQNVELLGSTITLMRSWIESENSSYVVRGPYIHEDRNMINGKNQTHIREEITTEQIRNKYPEELSTYRALNLDLATVDYDISELQFNLIRLQNTFNVPSQTHLLRATNINEELNMYTGLPQTHEAFGTNVVSNLNIYSGAVTHRINGIQQDDWKIIY